MSHLRRFAKLTLVLSLALSTQSVLVVQTLFVLRQDYIAEHLCKNRHRPEMRCDGKCFLADRVTETQHHDHDDHQKAPRERPPALQMWLAPRTAAFVPPPRSLSFSRGDALLPEAPFAKGLFRPPRPA